jgi:hypothetical protein
VVSEEGVISVPVAFLVASLLTFGIGTWALLHRWRMLTEIQLRLDRCTGETARTTEETFERIQELNEVIRIARATLAAAIVLPEAAEAARAALEGASAAEEAIVVAWQGKRAFWLVRGGCGGSGDRARALPSLPWVSEPPDELGPRPLKWESETSNFKIQAWNGSRRSVARVGPKEGDFNDGEEPRRWSLEWTIPE